jgi:hypothetical protein
MAWKTVPALVRLRDAFNARFPNRDKGSDGTIGDVAHQGSPSGHNPDDTAGSMPEDGDSDTSQDVRALDVDAHLNETGWGMWQAVQSVLARMRALGPAAPLKYIIFNRRIWTYDSGWAEQPYDGSDPHTGHAHFSCRPGAGGGSGNPENYSGPWGFEDGDEMTDDQIEKLADKIGTAVANKLLSADVIPYTGADGNKDSWQLRTAIGYQTEGVRRERELAEAQIARLDALTAAVTELVSVLKQAPVE